MLCASPSPLVLGLGVREMDQTEALWKISVSETILVPQACSSFRIAIDVNGKCSAETLDWVRAEVCRCMIQAVVCDCNPSQKLREFWQGKTRLHVKSWFMTISKIS